MADNDTRNTAQRNETADANTPGPASASKASPTAKTGGKRGKKRRGSQVDRWAPQHQARVLAMQALYEDDLTEHGLDEILQHIGEQERGEHRDYYARARADSRKAVEEIAFLARNTDRDAGLEAIARFHDASERVLGAVFAQPEADGEDGDLPEESLQRNRTSVERSTRSLLTTYRNDAEGRLKQEDGDPALASLAKLEEDLARLEFGVLARLKTTLANEERSSRETVMDLLGRTVALARGVVTNRETIDPTIEKAAPAFPIPQLASIDRAVLRIAVYELQFEPEAPFKAVINEGVEIAKHYGGPHSGRFVNGVLRTISERLPAARTERTPPHAGG